MPMKRASEPPASAGGGTCVHEDAQLLRPDAVAIVAKTFADCSVPLVILEQWRQGRHDVVHRHEVLEQKIEPRADQIAADEQCVLVPGAADDADVALIGAHAAIGTTRHAHADLFAVQTQAAYLRVEL